MTTEKDDSAKHCESYSSLARNRWKMIGEEFAQKSDDDVNVHVLCVHATAFYIQITEFEGRLIDPVYVAWLLVVPPS